MSDSEDLIGLIKGFGLILIVLVLMLCFFKVIDMPNQDYNTTEQVIEKHIADTRNGDIRLYIITNNYTFSVDNPTYDSLRVGDDVTINHVYDELLVDGKRFFAE